MFCRDTGVRPDSSFSVFIMDSIWNSSIIEACKFPSFMNYSYSSARSAQVALFFSSSSSINYSFGKTSIAVENDGRMIISMKPCEALAMFVVVLSMNWLTGKLCYFSRSPCAKNSQYKRSVHFRLSSHFFVALEISAKWNIRFSSMSLSFSLSGSNSLDDMRDLSKPRSEKCFDMSVARTV